MFRGDWGKVPSQATWSIVVTGHMLSQSIQAISQGRSTEIVSNGLINGSGCGHMATQAPQFMQAFQPILKSTGERSDILLYLFVFRIGTKVTGHRLEEPLVTSRNIFFTKNIRFDFVEFPHFITQFL